MTVVVIRSRISAPPLRGLPRLRARAVALLGIAVLAAGCRSGPQDTAHPVRPLPKQLAAVLTHTAMEHGADVRLTVAGRGDATVTYNGVVNFDRGESWLTARLPDGGRLESRFLHGVLYLHAPGLAPVQGWTRYDLRQSASAVPPSMVRLAAFPLRTAQLLYGGTRDAAKVSVGHLFGVAVTKYRVVVDVPAVAREAPPYLRPPFALLQRQLSGATLGCVAWMDSQQRLRRLQYETRDQRTVTMDLVRFAAVPRIQPPPGVS